MVDVELGMEVGEDQHITKWGQEVVSTGEARNRSDDIFLKVTKKTMRRNNDYSERKYGKVGSLVSEIIYFLIYFFITQ